MSHVASKNPMSDFRQALNRKDELASRIVEIQSQLTSETSPRERKALKIQIWQLGCQIRAVKTWLRENEGSRKTAATRRAIKVLCDFYVVCEFVVKFATEHGYELSDKERDVVDEARRLVEGHLEKRKPDEGGDGETKE